MALLKRKPATERCRPRAAKLSFDGSLTGVELDLDRDSLAQ
jgi:hypothetical protein